MKTRRILLTVLASLAGAACTLAAETAAVPIIRDGQPAAYLEIPDGSDSRITDAATDMISILQRAAGASLPTRPSDGLIPIHIAEASQLPAPPFSVPHLEEEEFLLAVDPDAIWIIGGAPLGAQHGIYTLLRDLGCRWIMPGDIGECLPQTKSLNLAAGKKTVKPDFRFREIWYAYGSSPEAAERRALWLRRNRMNHPPIQHGHNLTNTLAVFAPFEKRPELYALVQGHRKKSQICTSNPEAVELVIKSIKQYLAKNPAMESYSLCPDDNHEFCECESCRALDSGRIDSGGLPSIADRYQVFLNHVLAGIKDEFPNVGVTTYAYNLNHTDPPVSTPVDPRTYIFATTSVYCSAHGIGDACCPSRQAFKELLRKWTAFTQHVIIYEYDPVPYSGGLPWPMWKAHAGEMAVYKQIGIKGLSFEGQNSWAAYFPNYYIGVQTMWDSSQDGAALLADMLESFFGPAAPDMSVFYDTLGSVFDGLDKKAEWSLVEYPNYFSSQTVEKCRAALDAVEAKEVPDTIAKRLEMVRLSFDQMDAYLAIRRADSSTSYDGYNASIEKLNRAMDRMAAINEDYLLVDIAKEKTAAGLSDRFAREQGFINQWLLCGPFDNTGMEGHDRVYPPEQAVDPAATYTGKGNATVSWKPSNVPDWKGYVDLLREFTDTDWSCAYALCWVTVDKGPRDVVFRVGSNDSVKVFLNGAEICNQKVERGATPDDDEVPVTLPEGTSTILLKIGQTGLNWGFYFRITEPDSVEVPKGVHVSTAPPK